MPTRSLTLLAALVGTAAAAVLSGARTPVPTARLPRAPVAARPAAAPFLPAARAQAVAAPVAARRQRTAPAPVQARAETPAERGARVLASLDLDWRSLGYRVEFRPARDGLLGVTVPAQRLVQVYVKDDETDLVLAHSIAHELGHVVDAVRGTAATRAAYLVLRGLPLGTPWYGCAGCTDYATPAGDWAEVFAAWLAGPGDFRSTLAPPPTAAQLAGLAALVS